MKTLHNFTLTLHMASVDLLLGGLVLALAFALAGQRQAAGMIVHRLPTLMAFVIGMGVPPLLFSQLLYGQAIATGGTYWVAVIMLLAASFWSLFLAAKRADQRQKWAAPGFAALTLVLTIAFLYSNNMTPLHGNLRGFQLNLSDPSLLARWLFFVAGAFPATGAALALLSLRSSLGEDTGRVFARGGGAVLAGGVLMQATLADLAVAAQPQTVFASVMKSVVYSGSAYGWIVTAALLFVLGLLGFIAASNRAASGAIATAAAAVAFLNVASTVMIRDGIRDYTLRAAGFEVWNRQVAANWASVAIMLTLFFAALAAIAYLSSVLTKARRVEETYA